MLQSCSFLLPKLIFVLNYQFNVVIAWDLDFFIGIKKNTIKTAGKPYSEKQNCRKIQISS